MRRRLSNEQRTDIWKPKDLVERERDEVGRVGVVRQVQRCSAGKRSRVQKSVGGSLVERFSDTPRPASRQYKSTSVEHTEATNTPTIWEAAAGHVGLARVSKQAQLPCSGSSQAAAVDPNVHFFVTEETSMHLRRLAHTHNGRVRILVIAVPHRRVARRGVIFEAIDDEFDRGCRVGSEDQVPFFGVSTEETKCPLSYSVYSMSRKRRW